MDKTKRKHTYLFLDPNTPEELARAFRRILLEKLLTLPPQLPGETADRPMTGEKEGTGGSISQRNVL